MTGGPGGPGGPPEEEPPVVSLLDEAGVELRFHLHDAIDVDGRSYYLVEAADDPEQVLLLRETAGTLEPVQGAELDRVLALLDDEDTEGGTG